MQKAKMIENEKNFLCSQGHLKQAVTITLDPKLSKNKRLLCPQCLENTIIDGKAIGLKIMISEIKDAQEKKIEKLEYIIQCQIKLIEQLSDIVDQIRSNIIQQLDQIITILSQWIQNLQQQIQQYSKYSFQDELEAIIQNQYNTDDELQLIKHEIQKSNNSWTQKLNSKLDQVSKQDQYKKFREVLQSSELNGQLFNQSEQEQLEGESLQQITSYQQNILEEGEIRLKLIDQSVKQSDICKAIVFDSTGSIMISTLDNEIKVWKFLNGTLQLTSTLEGHTDQIQCLIYSKKQNSFISVALDQTIRCWKYQNQNLWVSSQPYQQHKDFIRCIILNSNEDLVFSGSEDKSIKVWKVDFHQNKLIYYYTLDKHNNYVISLSLSQSENLLVSCAQDQNQIIIWERRQLHKYEFKQFVKQSVLDYGFQVKFIKENYFIWITGGQQIDKLYIFEFNQGVFQESKWKTVQFMINNQIYDENCFPIIYNKERNLIVIRHKTFIYILREMNDGTVKIVNQLNCNINDIYGSVTNNGQYLVYWDGDNEGYSIYELLYK
ncbi:unnamed protein product [Paramecium octaurelia]|uniref:WD40-repeat-containing domain n=1 Tax=Paramecium octaurelia TaxID=43137 RepID=A0A8S1YAU7_PAROT|nr:unnamed protein product [Paramecium octaurelia]